MDDVKKPKEDDIQKILDYLNGSISMEDLKEGLGPDYSGNGGDSGKASKAAYGAPFAGSIRDFYELCQRSNPHQRETFAALYLKTIEEMSRGAGLDTKDIMYIARGAVYSIVRDNRKPDFTVQDMMEFWKKGARRDARDEALENLSEVEKHLTLNP